MNITTYNVEALGTPLGQYSHVTRVKAANEFLFIAGMLASGATFDAQCAGVFGQVEQALKSAGARWDNVVQFTTYMVHSQDIPKFMEFRLREFPKMFANGAYPPNTLLIVDRLVRETMLVEVQTVAADSTGPAPYVRTVQRTGVPRTGMDWEIDAGGIEDLLLRLTDEYGARKLYVTENGSSFPDVLRPDGTIDDPERRQYLTAHLAACASAARKGAPLAGYFAWSLLDNFEWAYGYDKRFGLVHVDYDTQVRTIKGSGHHYADIIGQARGRQRKAA